MTKKTEPCVASEPTEYPLTPQEFSQEIKQPESRAAFYALTKGDGHKPRAEWQRLYKLFQTQPVGTPWLSWIKEGGK